MADPRTSPPPPTARSSAAEWMLTGLLAGNLAWTTLCLGGYLAQTMAVTVALTGLTLAVHLLHRARGIERAPLHPAGWLVLPFLAYGAANALWITPVPWLGWLDWLGWAQLGAVFWVALNGVRSPGPRAALLGTVFALAAVSAALGVYQCFGHTEWLMLGRRQAEQFFGRASGSFGIPNSLAALLLLVLPAASALALRPGIGAARRLAWSALAAWYAFGLYLTISRGGWLACALALAAAPLLMGRLPKARRVGLALGALAVGVALVAGLYFAAPRVRARLDAAVQDAGERTRPIMWRGAWQIFAEHPAWGGGAGGFNVLFEKHRPERYQDEPQWAHNDYVNTLADYGAVGFALFFGACGFIVWRCRRGARMVSGANGEAQGRGADLPHSASCRAGSPNPAAPNPTAEERSTAAPLPVSTAGFGDPALQFSPWLLRGLALGVLAFALQLFVDFHFKIPALAMAFAVVSATLVSAYWPAPVPSGTGVPPVSGKAARLACGAAALAVLAFTGLWAVPLYRAEALRTAGRDAIDRLARRESTPAERRATLARAEAALERAVVLHPRHAQAWADLSYVRSLRMHEEPAQTVALGRAAETAARRALALTSVLPEAWVRLGVALDMQDRWGDAGEAFVRAFALAPRAVNPRFYYAYHLAQRPFTRAMARAEVETCLRLDPGHRAAQLLRQQLATGQGSF